MVASGGDSEAEGLACHSAAAGLQLKLDPRSHTLLLRKHIVIISVLLRERKKEGKKETKFDRIFGRQELRRGRESLTRGLFRM